MNVLRSRHILFFVLSIVILLFCGQNLPAVKPPVRLKITFLCMGAYAATYHADKDCPALKQCQGKVKIYSLGSAKKMGRKPCLLCVDTAKE